MKLNFLLRFLAILVLAAAAGGRDLFAGRYDEMVEAVARTGAKVNPAPVKNLDELFEQTLRRRGIAKPANAVDELAAVRRLAREVQVTDPTVLRVIDDLPAGQQRKLAAILMDGAEKVKKGVPDVLTRGRLLQMDEAGDVLVASSRHGEEFVREAVFLKRAFDEGVIKSVNGKPVGSFADFARIMASPKGANYWKFYAGEAFKKHWKKLAAAGVVTWFLADPDFFIDGAGEITEKGFRGIRDLVGEIIASALRGLLVPTDDKLFEYAAGLLVLGGLGFTYLAWKRRWFFFGKNKQDAEA